MPIPAAGGAPGYDAAGQPVFLAGKLDDATQYVRKVGASGQELDSIDHAASAKANLQAAGQNFKAMFTADKLNPFFTRDAGAGAMILGTLLAPALFIAEVADPVVQPVLAVKNLADAAVHGIVAGFQKVF